MLGVGGRGLASALAITAARACAEGEPSAPSAPSRACPSSADRSTTHAELDTPGAAGGSAAVSPAVGLSRRQSAIRLTAAARRTIPARRPETSRPWRPASPAQRGRWPCRGRHEGSGPASPSSGAGVVIPYLGAGAIIASAPRRRVSARAPTAFRRSRVRQTGTIRWRKEQLPHDRPFGQTLSHQSRGMVYAERRRCDRPDSPCDGYATAAWPDQRHTTPVAARRALCVVTAGRR